jgi:CBS domain containing-hemolysin-like protein
MESDLMFKVFTGLAGLLSVLLSYYSVSLTRLNSAQIERVLGIESETDTFRGIRPAHLLLALQIAAVCIEIVFLLGLANIVFSHGWSVRTGIIFLVIALSIEIFGWSFLPSAFPMRDRNALVSGEAILFMCCTYLLIPITILIEFISVQIQKIFFPRTDEERISDAEETIKSIINVGEKEGIFKEDDGEMLQSIVEFSETIVREVMTPRIDLKCLDIESSLPEFIDLVIESGYSKIPVYRERIDDIVGNLYAKDVLKFWNNTGGEINIGDIMRQPYFIPETKKVRDLLREFQRDKMHMAIVVDEYGGVAGVVTIEDLLEEIVGEIHDEYDTEQEMIQTISDASWDVDAKIDLDELEEFLDFEFPRDNYETLGGFLFAQIGRIPAIGEIVNYGSLKIRIKDADDRRISRVIIYKYESGEKESLITKTAAEDE